MIPIRNDMAISLKSTCPTEKSRELTSIAGKVFIIFWQFFRVANLKIISSLTGPANIIAIKPIKDKISAFSLNVYPEIRIKLIKHETKSTICFILTFSLLFKFLFLYV